MSFGKLGAMGRGFGHLGALGTVRYNPLTALGTDLIAWWDADANNWGTTGGMTIATGVSSWLDIVAGYNMAQATGSAQPTFSSSSWNGAPAVAGDGIDDCLTCTDAAFLAALPTGAAGCELWALAQNTFPGATAGSVAIIGYGSTASSNARRLERTSVSSTNRARGLVGDGAVGQPLNGTLVNLSSRSVLRLAIAPTSTGLTVDANADGTLSVVPNTSADRGRLFASSLAAASGFWQGPLAAALITKPLSAGAAAGLQNYLLSRRRL